MDYKEQLNQLIMDLEGKDKATSEQLNLLFQLNNHFFPNQLEYAKHCSPCVQRVYKRLKNFNNG
jgi:hypothetical protein